MRARGRPRGALGSAGRRAVVVFCAASCTLLSIECGVLTGKAGAATRYNVRLDTTARVGQRAQLGFDFVSASDGADTLELLAFAHDGRRAPIVRPGWSNYEGGPVWGHLFARINPAPRTVIENDYFYNQLTVPFDSLGKTVSFAFQLPEPSPAPRGMPDELTFFYLTDSSASAFDTMDPLGTNALFSVCVTGAPGGDLNVYWPMTFIAPDTLALDLSVVGLPHAVGPVGRLWIRSVAVKPSSGVLRVDYYVPAPGGMLRMGVYDMAGRLVARPIAGKRPAGVWSAEWKPRDSRERALDAGTYVVQLEMGGQTFVRQIVLTR